MDKQEYRIAIVASRFNNEITEGLLAGATEALRENNITEKNIKIFRVPGAFEIPLLTSKLCVKGKFDAIICLGAVIKGQTAHFEYISESVTHALMRLNIKHRLPISFGILTCYTEEQAISRSMPGIHNKGREAALAAIEMIETMRKV